MSNPTDEVRQYYEVNTPAFQQFGQGSRFGALRRAVWGEGVKDREQAFAYVDELIAAELRAVQKGFSPPLRVFDFGCGLGSSLIALQRSIDIEGVGITISPVQARMAERRFRHQGVADRLRCVQGDFLNLPGDLSPGHLVFAIESFVHTPGPGEFFRAAARQLVPGGLAIVCDDLLTPRGRSPISKAERRLIEDFRHGWVAPCAALPAEANVAAKQAGFEPVKSVDLTPYLELRRPRDRALSLAISLVGRLPIPGYRWRSLVGGDALQKALLAGLFEYRFMVWRRTG